jgi:hypothetical protein
MRTLMSCGLAVIASGYAFAASAACESPMVVSVPDGKTATMEQLLAAQGQIKVYMAAMNDYIACIDKEVETLGETATPEVVAEMEGIAAAFNDQVKAYRAANPAPAAN